MAGKRGPFAKCAIAEHVEIAENDAQFWFIEVNYVDGAPETYALPVHIAVGEAAHAISTSASRAVIARFSGAEEAVLYDAIWNTSFREQLFRTIQEGKSWTGKSGQLRGAKGSGLTSDSAVPSSQVLSAEQSNSSMLFEGNFS